MFQHILVPIDGSAAAACGLREAVALAAAHRARLLVLHLVDNFGRLLDLPSAAAYDNFVRALRSSGEALLAQARARAQAAGVPCETLLQEITSEAVGDAIATRAAQHGCDLVVVGSHGRRGMERFVLGSRGEEVVRACRVPVLLVRAAPDAAPLAVPAASARDCGV